MPERQLVTLNDLPAEHRGEIDAITGGIGLQQKLTARGVRPGKMIKKISAANYKGPVVFEIDDRQMAVGCHMAARIIIKI